ncbi:MAG: hypothetical protein MZV63_14880 [Marinilabiliales bacterium]|nr:hypothetical protein [Marinilabiliales bacterium]
MSGTPPSDLKGEIQIRIVARDNAGHQAETIATIQSGNPGSAELITTTTGFITLVDPNGAVDGKHDLRVHKGIPDLEFDQNTSEIRCRDLPSMLSSTPMPLPKWN